MPNPKINQQIEEQLFRMDRTAKALGLGPLDPAQLKRAHERIYTGVVHALSQIPAGDKILGQSPTQEPAQNLLMRGQTPQPVVDVMRPGMLNQGFHVPGRPLEQLQTTSVPVTNSQGEPQPILMPRPKITMRAA